MSRVYFTSDLHFGHNTLCKALRGMSSEESDKLIIENWNETITKRDLVYILGDFVMEKAKLIKDYICQLNGEIIIVAGNHDTLQCCKEFSRLGIPVVGCYAYKGFILSHIPLAETEVLTCRGNIHGHIHNQGTIEGNEYTPKQPNRKYYNVNTEFHNYTPILFETIIKYFENLKE